MYLLPRAVDKWITTDTNSEKKRILTYFKYKNFTIPSSKIKGSYKDFISN